MSTVRMALKRPNNLKAKSYLIIGLHNVIPLFTVSSVQIVCSLLPNANLNRKLKRWPGNFTIFTTENICFLLTLPVNYMNCQRLRKWL